MYCERVLSYNQGALRPSHETHCSNSNKGDEYKHSHGGRRSSRGTVSIKDRANLTQDDFLQAKGVNGTRRWFSTDPTQHGSRSTL